MIDHSGGLSSGHYIAQCYSKEEQQWIRYDDSMSMRVSEDNIKADKLAYILFYKKREQKEAPDRDSHVMDENGEEEQLQSEYDSISTPPTEETNKNCTEEMSAENKEKCIAEEEKTKDETATERNDAELRKSERESKPTARKKESQEMKDKKKSNDDMRSSRKKENQERKDQMKGDDDSRNSNVEEEKDTAIPETYCICKKQYKKGDLMMECNKCKGWFHPKCIQFKCGECLSTKEGKTNATIVKLKEEEKERLSTMKANELKLTKLEIENNRLKAKNSKLEADKSKRDSLDKKSQEEMDKKLTEQKELYEIREQAMEKKYKENELKMKDQIGAMYQEIQLLTKRIEAAEYNKEHPDEISNDSSMGTNEMEEATQMVERIQEKEEEIKNLKLTMEKQLKEKDKDLATEKQSLVDQINQYGTRLETALCELAQNERVRLHLCDRLDNLMLLNERLELELSSQIIENGTVNQKGIKSCFCS